MCIAAQIHYTSSRLQMTSHMRRQPSSTGLPRAQCLLRCWWCSTHTPTCWLAPPSLVSLPAQPS